MRLIKVSPGQALKIPADTHNAMIDAARAHILRTHHNNARVGIDASTANIVKVLNNSGANVPRLAVLGIDAPIVEPNDQADPRRGDQDTGTFFSMIRFKGNTPADSHFASFVVTIEPIEKDVIGRAVVMGSVIAWLDVVSESDEYADIKVGDVTVLETGPIGSARIIWKQPPADRPTGNPQLALAMVKIGVIGQGPGRWAEIVCAGQEGQPNPQDESYYIQWIVWRGGDVTLPVVPDAAGGQIVLATSSSEMKTHTHSLNTGTIVRATREVDEDGQLRWVF